MSEKAWQDLYSEVGLDLKPSPIRELLKLTKRPGMISFAGGNPDPAIFPVKEFAESAHIFAERGQEVLQYGTTEGFEPLKGFLADWMAPKMGRVTRSDEMLITTGSQQVTDLVCSIMVDPGDRRQGKGQGMAGVPAGQIGGLAGYDGPLRHCRDGTLPAFGDMRRNHSDGLCRELP